MSTETSPPSNALTIRAESRAFYKALGRHITVLRKQRGMTQAELARAIGVSQQAVFAYELGERRVSVLLLGKMAKVFSISLVELIGLTGHLPERKRRLSPRAMRHAERLQALSKTQQRFVIRIMDVLEASNLGLKQVKTRGKDGRADNLPDKPPALLALRAPKRA